jgi:hypothetical protein
MDTIYNSYSRLKQEENISIRISNPYLPQYRGTKELEDGIQATINATIE